MFFSKMIMFGLLILLIGCVHAQDVEVSVVRLTLSYEQLHTLELNSSLEYMVDFIPNEEQRHFPVRMLLSSSGGDASNPVLITARQRTGAVTWQLPYEYGDRLLYSMERALCHEQANGAVEPSDCAGEESFANRDGFSLHISTTCSSQMTVTIQATPTRDWRLPFMTATSMTVSQGAPRSYYYNFTSDQDKVRIALASEDDVCAMISVQNVTCPLRQTVNEARTVGQRMTMLKSGGVQLSRSQYPLGFFVVVIVKGSDSECTGEQMELEQDWLWESAVLGTTLNKDEDVPRSKELSITVQAALTRGQYAIATSVTFIIFLLFYVLFLGLVFAQRWPAFAKFVEPKAVIVDSITEAGTGVTSLDGSIVLSDTPRRKRRDSTATFDSSDNSDTDDEEDTNNLPPSTPADPSAVPSAPNATAARDVTQNNGHLQTDSSTNQQQTPDNGVEQPVPSQSTPFGLPARLHLGALSRRRARVLVARSDRYLHTLYTVAVFYALPVLQFVAAAQIFLNVSGSLDFCYYNFLCSHPAGALSDFNHVFSNLGYLLLGALFLLQLRRRRRRREHQPRSEEYGIPAHYGLLSSLGAGMMVVALLSASYHVCPNRLNFQFDTAFMYVLAVVAMVKIYQSRHPDVNARAHATFGVLAVLIAFVVWGVLGGGAFFWAIFTVIHLFTFLLLSLRIYYVGQFRLEKETLQMAARGLAQMPKFGVKPLYKTRLILLLIANAVNWMFALYGLWTQEADFASHLLQVLLGNALMYMIFYLVMKLMHGERPRWYAWCFLAGAAISWAPALYFFVSGSSDWSTTAALSRHLNHECYVLHFYDSHDLWHLLSAVALYLSFNAMLTWDDGLAAVKRTEIAVF